MIRFVERTVLYSQAVACLTALMACSSIAGAQPNGSSGVWGTVGGGIIQAGSHGNGPGLSAGFSAQRGSRLGGARLDFASPGLSDEITAVTALGGVVSARGRRFGAASVGLSGVGYRPCLSGCGLLSSGETFGPRRYGAGVMLTVDGALRVGDRRGAGLGFTAFSNINTARSFLGIALTLSAGRWR